MDDEEVASDVVGNGADDRMEYAEQIADSAEVEQHPDALDVPDGYFVDEQGHLVDTRSWAERMGPDVPDDPEPRTFRVKVDGEEVELTEEQARTQLGKGLAADRRLQQAAEARRQLEKERAQLEQERAEQKRQADELLANAKNQTQPQDADEVFAKQLQQMPPGEAAKLLKQLRSGLVPAQQLTAVEAKVANTMAFEAAGERAKREYADILADPIQRAAFLQLDADALDEQRRTGQFERYEQRHDRIAGMVRGRFGATQSIADKAERKRTTLTSLPVAHTKARLPEPEDDSEPDARETIAEMARARGQTYAQR